MHYTTTIWHSSQILAAMMNYWRLRLWTDKFRFPNDIQEKMHFKWLITPLSWMCMRNVDENILYMEFHADTTFDTN